MSELLLKARALQREANSWIPKFRETGELDQASLGRMQTLRYEILTSLAENAMDRLMQFGCVRAAASYLFLGIDDDMEGDAEVLPRVRESLAEILIGLNAIRPQLEADAGETLEDLGLFVDGKTLQ